MRFTSGRCSKKATAQPRAAAVVSVPPMNRSTSAMCSRGGLRGPPRAPGSRPSSAAKTVSGGGEGHSWQRDDTCWRVPLIPGCPPNNPFIWESLPNPRVRLKPWFLPQPLHLPSPACPPDPWVLPSPWVPPNLCFPQNMWVPPSPWVPPKLLGPSRPPAIFQTPWSLLTLCSHQTPPDPWLSPTSLGLPTWCRRIWASTKVSRC